MEPQEPLNEPNNTTDSSLPSNEIGATPDDNAARPLQPAPRQIFVSSDQPAVTSNTSAQGGSEPNQSPRPMPTGQSSLEPTAPAVSPAVPTTDNRQVFSNYQREVPQASTTGSHTPDPSTWYGSQSTPQYGSATTSNVFSTSKKPIFKRPLFLVGLVFFVALLGGGYVFGFYIPNKPENVYKTGISRSGLAIDKLTTAAASNTSMDEFKNANLSGTISVSGPSGKQSGRFSTRYDSSKSDSTITYAPGGGMAPVSVQAMTDLPKGSNIPDVYFKVSGITALGLDGFVPGISQYDNKWISISSDYLKSIIGTETKAPDQPASTFTSDDAAALTKIVVSTSRDYIFSNDPAKAVLVNKSYKGKEIIENKQSTYHYVVGINAEHAKDYCNALVTNVMAAPAFKHIPGAPTDNMDSAKQSAIDDCNKSIDDSLKDSNTLDMWVSSKTKLISRIRATDPKDFGNYADFGQNYVSGTTLPMYISYHSTKDKSDVRFDLSTDSKSNISTGKVAAKTTTDNDNWTVDADFTFKPDKVAVTLKKPTDAVPVQQVMQKLGIDPADLENPTTPSTVTSTTSQHMKANNSPTGSSIN